MKMTKRVLALFLVLCSLLSVIPAPVIAVDGSATSTTEPVIVTYDFQLEKSQLTYGNSSSFVKAALSGSAVSSAIANYYSAGTLNWKYVTNNAQTFRDDGYTVNEMLYFGGDTNPWSGLRFGLKVTPAINNNSYPVGHWTALELRVETAGKYDLTLDHFIRGNCAANAEIYMLPGNYSDIASIEAAMAQYGVLKNVNFAKSNNTIEEATTNLGQCDLLAGSYTLVFKATQSRTAATEAYIHAKSLVMEMIQKIDQDLPKNVVYDFSQANTTDKTGYDFKGYYFYNNKLPDKNIDGAYESGSLNWRIAASNTSLLVGSKYSKVDSYLGFSNGTWSGLRLAARATLASDNSNEYATGHWFAFNLASPGAGKYIASLNYQTRQDGNQDLKIYLVEGALTDASEIQTAITSATSLTNGFDTRADNNGNISTSKNTYVDAKKNLGELELKDSVYTLVIHSAGEGVYTFVNSLVLAEKIEGESTGTETTTVPEQTTVPEETLPPVTVEPLGYSFAVGSSALVNANGANMAGTSITDAANKNTLASFYDQGLLSWKFSMDNLDKFKTETNTVTNTYYFGGNASFKYGGLRLGVLVREGSDRVYPAGYWTAFTIKSPGEGNFQMSLDYQTRKDGSSAGEVYIIKGAFSDVDALEAAMKYDRLRQVVDFTSSSTEFSAVQNADLGIMTFESGEYTLVFKAATGSASGAYMHINGVNFAATTKPVYTPELPESSKPVELKPLGYTFEIGASALKNEYGAAMSGTLLTDPINLGALEKYYADGYISWKYQMDNLIDFQKENNKVNNTYYIGGNDTHKYAGLRLGVLVREGEERAYPAGHWTAFTIKSPGKGNYKIDFGYQTRKDGATVGEIYIIKGVYTDKAKLEEAIKYENLRQVVDFSSKNTEFSAVQTADLGIITFAEGEYTVVFKAKSGTAAGAYMHINSLKMTKTDKAAYTPVLPESAKPVELKPIGYSFELGASALTNIYGANMSGTVLTNKENLEALEQYYADGYISWKYSMDNIADFQKENNNVNNTYYFGGSDSHKYAGLRLGVLVREGEERAYPAGHWTAFTLKSPGSGNYKISFGYQTRKDGTSAGEVYIIKGAFTDKAALENAIKYENLRQVVDFTSGSSEFSDVQTIDLGVMKLEKGEYTLVFKAKAGSAAGSYMHVNGLTFVKTNDAAYTPELPESSKPGKLEPIDYSFEVGTSALTNAYGASMAGSLLTNKENLDALEKYYEDGYISWKYAADNLDIFKTETNKVDKSFYFGGTSVYKNKGLRLGALVREGDEKSYPFGYWTAFTIKSPGAGRYHLTLDYQIRADATAWAEIYLIKGALTDKAAIEKQMTKDNLIGAVNMKAKKFELFDRQAELGYVSFEKGEYTLVFKAAEDSGNQAAYMFLSKLTVTHESLMPPPGPNEVVYNFDLHNNEDGIYTGKAYLKDKIPDLAERYAKGKQNWMYYGKNTALSDEAHMFNGNYGMSMYTMKGDWMAFKIKSPGPGEYTFTVNHALSGNGALGAIYIIPADTPVSEIETAMDHNNRVGKIEFYNDTGKTPVVNGATSTVGTFNFGSADEYIMVIEAYENTPYKRNYAYMWISQVIVKEGNYTSGTVVGQRKIKPIVVNDGPCRTMEPTLYITTAEVNGQDYLFMPTEGAKMYVFNMEDMVKVREVVIPFNTCRGITTDKDGMIWLVGNTSLIHRYDPYTNTGMTTYNYKLSGGIDDSTSGFDLEVDDEGNLYFGTFSKGYIVKYDPVADKFSKVAGDINSDAGYSCGIEIKDGYLYAAMSGDRNIDGKKTAEVVKIDLKADKVVARLDIMEQFGDTEVMVRGAGIRGETLFMGGLSLKGFIAIDINTMELKDYGVPKSISFAPSEEIDGKCYMYVPGYGMYEYVVADDTLTKINGMDSVPVGFRAQSNSSITLSNNPLFPGVSYVTNASTGIKIYNMETKQVFTPDLYDDKKDGSGQIIRTIVAGEPGDDHIYIGGFNTLNCAKVNVNNGENTIFEATSAQTDVMLWHEGVLYVGNYNAGNVVRINFDDPDRNVIMITMKSMYKQARVHALAAGDGYLFAGTVPDAFLFGGCLAIINLNTQERTVEQNLIPNQCITSLAYNDGIVFGGTSISGGTGAAESATGTESAVIFAYDVEKKEKIAELDLRKIFPELPGRLPYIDGLIADPDVKNNGKFWGMISETLFSFTFDKTTKTFKVKEELSFGKSVMPSNNGRATDDCNFAFDGNGYMYVAFGDQGGMRKVNLANPSDNERINMETPKTFALGADGNLYYSCANEVVKMYPLNVTEDDWVLAEAVDKMILDIGEKITLDSEEKIVAARKAYNELTLKHRALVQYMEILEIAETDIVECKIDAIGEVTLEKRAEIEAIIAAYNALSAAQQKYVKNYQILNAADLALQALVNAEVAAKMQKIIDALKDPSLITLEDELDIRSVKDQYDALLFLQRQLVDTTKLDAALAKIAELRQEKIDRLSALIAQIGEVTLEDEPIIDEAMALYNWLYMDEREKVDYPTLLAGEKALQKLQKAAAAEVDALIEAIGDSVSYASGDAIRAARAAYDALTEGSKKYVKLLHILEEAESIYNSMIPIWAIVVIAVVVVGAAVTGTVLVIKKRKAKSTKVTTSQE